MRSKFWGCAQDRHIAVADAAASLDGEIDGIFDELRAVGPGVFRIVIGEQLADVVGADGAQNGVGDRVQDGVAVAVAAQADRVVDADAAQDQRAAFDEPVRIVSHANAVHDGSIRDRLRRDKTV